MTELARQIERAELKHIRLKRRYKLQCKALKFLESELREAQARVPTTEAALSWANQQSYSFSVKALDDYCAPRNLTWEADGMYHYITFKVKS